MKITRAIKLMLIINKTCIIRYLTRKENKKSKSKTLKRPKGKLQREERKLQAKYLTSTCTDAFNIDSNAGNYLLHLPYVVSTFVSLFNNGFSSVNYIYVHTQYVL